jgi:hypothetical protein
LLDMREQTDALMDAEMHSQTAAKFGLSFVNGIGYGGATAPEINTEGELCIGSISMTWKVQYRMR